MATWAAHAGAHYDWHPLSEEDQHPQGRHAARCQAGGAASLPVLAATAWCTWALEATWQAVGGLLAARRLRREPEPFEAEYDEDEFEDGEYEVSAQPALPVSLFGNPCTTKAVP